MSYNIYSENSFGSSQPHRVVDVVDSALPHPNSRYKLWTCHTHAQAVQEAQVLCEFWTKADEDQETATAVIKWQIIRFFDGIANAVDNLLANEIKTDYLVQYVAEQWLLQCQASIEGDSVPVQLADYAANLDYDDVFDQIGEGQGVTLAL